MYYYSDDLAFHNQSSISFHVFFVLPLGLIQAMRFLERPNPAYAKPRQRDKELDVKLDGYAVTTSLLNLSVESSKKKNLKSDSDSHIYIQRRNISTTMSLAAFISAIWAGFHPSPRRRRTVYIDPESIEPINHWFPGNRNKKQPRRLVETPTAGHWPEYRIAKKVVAKGRKRCGECGALVKEAKVPAASKREAKEKKGKKAASTARAVRSLRGRAVEYAG
jgi:hypothetical protein